MILFDKYELVIGLEVHVQLATETKLFSADRVAFGHPPNTNISAISLAHPGVLPMPNQQAIMMAVKMGLACNCTINQHSYFVRKHYTYPDLPKGYQLTQHQEPICIGGFVPIRLDNYNTTISLHHIHLEEDAGKSIHDEEDHFTCIDYNRAGVPLIEIVSNPSIKSADEAVVYMATIRKMVRYLGIGNGNMEEGNLRCDVNVSVRKKGETTLGTKVEMKNLNSLRSIKNGIDYEAKRLMQMIDNGEVIIQQTRGYDEQKNSTYAMRTKENADDYRYLTDPDLPPVVLSNEEIATIKTQIPELHFQREEKYQKVYLLPRASAEFLAEEKVFADFFEEILLYTKEHKAAANWMLGPIQTYLNAHQISIQQLPLSATKIATMIEMVQGKQLNYSDATTTLFLAVIEQPKIDILQLAQKLNLIQDNNADLSQLEAIIETIEKEFPAQVKDYKVHGKKGLIGFFVGETMKRLKQKLEPQMVNAAWKKKLDA